MAFGVVEVVTGSYIKDDQQVWICSIRCRNHRLQDAKEPDCPLCDKQYALRTRTLQQYVTRQQKHGYPEPAYIIAKQGPRVKGLRRDPTRIYRRVKFVGCTKWEFAPEETYCSIFV
jgi:hypothetical protein